MIITEPNQIVSAYTEIDASFPLAKYPFKHKLVEKVDIDTVHERDDVGTYYIVKTSFAFNYLYSTQKRYGYSFLDETTIKNHDWSDRVLLQFAFNFSGSSEKVYYKADDLDATEKAKKQALDQENKHLNTVEKFIATYMFTGENTDLYIDFFHKNNTVKGKNTTTATILDHPILFPTLMSNENFGAVFSLDTSIKANILARIPTTQPKTKHELTYIDGDFKGFKLETNYTFSVDITEQKDTNLSKELFEPFLPFILPEPLRAIETRQAQRSLEKLGIPLKSSRSQNEKYSNPKIHTSYSLSKNYDYKIKYNTLDHNNKEVVLVEPLPSKNLCNLVKTAKEKDNDNIEYTCEENKIWDLFNCIVKNITRDSSGKLSPLYYTFVLNQLVTFLKNPLKKLAPHERGFTIFQGEQNCGKSYFFEILESIFAENIQRLSNDDLKNMFTQSMNNDLEACRKARFFVLEEDLETSNKNKEILKKFSHNSKISYAQKYKGRMSLDVNYTTFIAINKKPHEVKTDIFLETGSTNRRFVMVNATTTLETWLNENGYTMEDIKGGKLKSKTAQEVITRKLLEITDYNYSFNELDKVDVDKKERVKTGIHTTDGLMLEKLTQMNDCFKDFINISNMPKDLKDKFFPDNNDEYRLPLTYFNKYCWNEKVVPYGRRTVIDPVKRIIHDNKLNNIRITAKDNVISFFIKDPRYTKEEVYSVDI